MKNREACNKKRAERVKAEFWACQEAGLAYSKGEWIGSDKQFALAEKLINQLDE